MFKGSKPKPFERPGVNLDRVTKTWQHVQPDKLSEGDIVTAKGEVISIELHNKNWYIQFFSGEVAVIADQGENTQTFYAFTEG